MSVLLNISVHMFKNTLELLQKGRDSPVSELVQVEEIVL